MRGIRFISLPTMILIAAAILIIALAGGWFFWSQQRYNQQNSGDDTRLPSQSQRAAALAMIPEQGTNLYALSNSSDSHFQNMTHFPQASSSAISSMIVHLPAVSVSRPISLPGVNMAAPISTNISSVSLSILNFPPGLTSDYQPTLADVECVGSYYINPLDLALKMQPTDVDLIHWFQEREWELTNQNPEDASINETGGCNNLLYILRNTKLSWFELCELGASFYNFYHHDYQTTAAFYVWADCGADHALTKFKPGDPEVRSILLAMHKTKDVLWNMVGDGDFVDGSGECYCLHTLYILDNDLVRLIKPGDPVLEFAYEHGKIGLLESLFHLGKLDDVIVLGRKTNLSGMNNDEKAEVAWIIGRTLYFKHCYVDAVPQLSICADDLTSKFCYGAGQLLIDCLLRTNQIALARARYERYVKYFKPNPSQFKELITFLAQSGEGVVLNQ